MNHILRSASDLSVQCGTIFIDKLPEIAKKKGYSSIAITDSMNMFGFIKFYKSCLKHKIKPILGIELSVRNKIIGDYKILAYAKDNIGLKELFEIISNAYLIYKEEYNDGAIIIPEEELFKLNTGNILITSGSVYGFIGKMIGENISDEKIKEEVIKWQENFKTDFFIELSRFQSKKYDINKIFSLSFELSRELNIKYIVTNPIFFENEDDYISHSIRVCAMNSEQLNKGLLNSIEKEFTYDMFFKDKDELAKLYFDLNDLTQNMDFFVNQINIELKLNFNDLPNYEIPKDTTLENYFEEKVFNGLDKRLKVNFNMEEYEINKDKYINRAKFEIDTIKNMKFIGYFLIVADFINWAKNNDIPVGPGRGSGAGSIVAYSLGITDLDPIPYDLLFERFLNPERVSMPDFDIDFCQEKRGLVIEYVQKKYGKDAVAQIMTNGTMATRSVIKDVARVLGLPYGLADNITQKIGLKQDSLEDAYNEIIPENIGLQKMIDNNELAKEIWDNGLKLEGITKSIGKHAAGILISPTKITDYCPVYHSEGMPVSQLDKNDVEYAGLVKFDFLGLKNLTVIHNAIKFIKKVHNIIVDIKNDFKDIDAYKLLQEGNTTAVFQLESSGMKKYLKKMKPDCFEDIIAILALYRPGPLGSGMVDSFIKRKLWEKNGKPNKENDLKFDYKYEISDYFTPALEECLKPTYGIIVYQEQVMKISQIIAGYSLGGADLLRRCISGDSIISLKDGNISLREIYLNKKQFIGNEINTFNEKLKTIELQKIKEVFFNGCQFVYELKTEFGQNIKATKEHLFLTPSGWKMLSELKENTIIALPNKDYKINEPIQLNYALKEPYIKRSSSLNFVGNSFIWGKITSIIGVGFEDVYDLSIENNHNYSVNGFIVHNCMGKKNLEEMAKQRSTFNDGAIKNGYSEELATHLFDLMEKFAEYGFNKSHSAAYAVITYQTAFLKTHYPIEFMAATLCGEESNTEKLEIFIRDCQVNKIKIFNPNINFSEAHFSPTKEGILYSLSALKGIGDSIAEEIVKERKSGGEYVSFENFCSRNVNVLNKKMLSSLIRSGCFDIFNLNRARYFDAINDILKQKNKIIASHYESVSLFDEYNVEKIYVSDKFNSSQWDILDIIKNEVEGIGFELTINMYSKYKEKIEKIVEAITPKYFLDENNLFILERNQALKGNMIYTLYGVIQEHIEGQNPRILIKDDNHQIYCTLNQRLLRGSYKLTKESIKKNKFIQCKLIVRIKEIEGVKRYFYNILDIENIFD